MKLVTQHFDVRIEEINLENYDTDEIKILRLKSKGRRLIMYVNIYVPLRQQVNWDNLEHSLVDMLHQLTILDLTSCEDFNARISPSLEMLNLR